MHKHKRHTTRRCSQEPRDNSRDQRPIRHFVFEVVRNITRYQVSGLATNFDGVDEVEEGVMAGFDGAKGHHFVVALDEAVEWVGVGCCEALVVIVFNFGGSLLYLFETFYFVEITFIAVSFACH